MPFLYYTMRKMKNVTEKFVITKVRNVVFQNK